jgi:hypothetical protein
MRHALGAYDNLRGSSSTASFGMRPGLSLRGMAKRRFGSLTEMEEFFREQGRKGGKKGGRAAAAKLSKDQRIARAKKAGEASAKVRAKRRRQKPKNDAALV